MPESQGPGQQDLKKEFKDDLQKFLHDLYLQQNTIPKLIDDETIPPHNLDEHYVKLEVVEDNGSEKKQQIDIDNLFEPIQRSSDNGKSDNDEIKKVLITGVAGSGKSTLNNFICYKWAKGQIFQDNFDYLIKVKLLKLLSFKQQKQEILSQICQLIRQSIFEQIKGIPDKKKQVELNKKYKQLKEIQLSDELLDRQKIVILLDGYDQIAHLDTNENKEVRNVLTTVFQNSNLNVIITSRPNAVSSVMQGKFNRKVELNSFNKESIEDYAQKFFAHLEQTKQKKSSSQTKDESEMTSERVKELNKVKGEKLMATISDNQALKDLAGNPLSMALLCIIWKNLDSEDKQVTEDFSITQLYEKTIQWLARRHSVKQQKKSGPQVNKNVSVQVYQQPFKHVDELKFLVNLGYESFVNERLEIRGQEIIGLLNGTPPGKKQAAEQSKAQSDTNKLNSAKNLVDKLKSLLQFGLLKRTSFSIDFTSEDQQLQNDKTMPSDVKQSKRFVAQIKRSTYQFIHLSFQEYLTARKFKDFIESEAQSQKKGATNFIGKNRYHSKFLNAWIFLAGLVGKNPDSLNTFWPAIVCNVDGVIEIGQQNKIRLLMILLPQVIKNNKIFYEILEKSKNKAHEQLRDKISRFVMESVFKQEHMNVSNWLNVIVKSRYMDERLLSKAMETVGLSAGRSNQASQLKQEEFDQNFKSTVQILSNLINRNPSQAQFLDFVYALTQKKNLEIKLFGLNSLATVCDKIKKENLKKLLQDENKINGLIGNLDDQRIHRESARVLIKIVQRVQQKRSQIIQKMLDRIINFETLKRTETQSKFTSTKLGQGFDTISKLIPLIVRMQKMHQTQNKQVTESQNLVKLCLTGRVKLVAQMIDGEHYNKAVNKLELLMKEKQQKYTMQAWSQYILEAIKRRITKLSEIHKQSIRAQDKQIMVKMITLIIVKANAVIEEGQTLRKCNSQYLQLLSCHDDTIRTSLLKQINSLGQIQRNRIIDKKAVEQVVALFKRGDSDVRNTAVSTINNIVEKLPKLITEQVVEQVVALFKDGDQHVRNTAVSTINNIVEKLPKLITEQVVEQVVALFKDGDFVRNTAVSTINNIVEKLPKLITEQVVEQVVALFKDGNWQVRNTAVSTINNIVEKLPKLITEQVVEQVVALFKDGDFVRNTAVSTINNIVEKLPKLITEQVVEQVVALFKDGNWNVRNNAVSTINNIVENLPKLITEQVVEQVVALFKDGNVVCNTAVSTINNIVEKLPKLITEQVVEQVVALYKDGDQDVRNTAVSTFNNIVKKLPKLITEQVVEQVVALFKDGDSDVRNTAVSTINNIVENLPKLITEQVVEQVVALFKDGDFVRNTAVSTINNIVEKLPKLITEQVVEQVVALFKDGNVVRNTAVSTFNNIVEKLPKLITEQVVEQVVVLFNDDNDQIRIKVFQSIILGIKNGVFKTKIEQCCFECAQFLIKEGYSNISQIQSFYSALGEKAESPIFVVPLVLFVLNAAELNKEISDQLVRLSEKIDFKIVIPTLQGRDPGLATKAMDIIRKSIKPQNFLRFSQPTYQVLLKIDEVSNELSSVLSKKQLIDLDYKSLPHVLVISRHGDNSLQKTIKRLVSDKMTQVISKIVKAVQSQKNKVLREITQQITNRMTWNKEDSKKSIQQSQTLDYENPLIKEYLQKLCCELVADEIMTKAQSQFLYQCINIGIDLGITRERSLLIGGKYYKIKTGTSYLNQIFKSVMNKKCGTDANIKRLTEHNPIFVNDSSVLDKAACDYRDVNSIVCSSKTIELNQIVLSFLEYKKTKGNKKFCLIEKRNYFGDVVAEKIVSKISYYSTHPSKKDTEEFRQKLFSKTGLGIEFSIRSISISPEQEDNIEKLLLEKSKSGNAKYKAYEDIKQMFKIQFQKATQSKLKKWELLNIAKSDPRVTEVRLDNIENEITDIKGIINTTGLKQQADFKQTLQKLKSISNNFEVYYKIFFWTVMDKIDAYRVASTDVVQKNNKVEQTTSQSVGIQVLKKGGTFVLSAAQNIPLIGGIFEYFNDFVDFVTEEVYDFKFDNQATSVTNIVKLKDSRSELELCIQQTIIKIMELKAKQIEDPSETQEESKIQAFIGWFKQKYEKMKQMMIEDKVKAFGEENPVAEIALSDATIFFSVVFKYSDKIMKATKKQSANPRILTETLIQYFKKGYKQFNDRIDKGLNDDSGEKQQQENLESDQESIDEKNMENEFEQKKPEDQPPKKQLQKQAKKPNQAQTKQKVEQKKEQKQQKQNKTQKQEIVQRSQLKTDQQTSVGCAGDECQIY